MGEYGLLFPTTKRWQMEEYLVRSGETLEPQKVELPSKRCEVW